MRLVRQTAPLRQVHSAAPALVPNADISCRMSARSVGG